MPTLRDIENKHNITAAEFGRHYTKGNGEGGVSRERAGQLGKQELTPRMRDALGSLALERIRNAKSLLAEAFVEAGQCSAVTQIGPDGITNTLFIGPNGEHLGSVRWPRGLEPMAGPGFVNVVQANEKKEGEDCGE